MSEPKIERTFKYNDNGEFCSVGLQNWPAPALPRYVEPELVRIGGRNIFGEPNLRIVWGQAAKRISCGQEVLNYWVQVVRGIDELAGHYMIGMPRFVIEEWTPPFLWVTDYDDWVQGPFPARGRYIHFQTVQTSSGEFCIPDERFLQDAERYFWHRRHRRYTHSPDELAPKRETEKEIRAYMDARNAQEEKERAEMRDLIREGYKEGMRRITSLHPNEGRAPDPYALAKRQRAIRRKIA